MSQVQFPINYDNVAMSINKAVLEMAQNYALAVQIIQEKDKLIAELKKEKKDGSPKRN